MENQKFSVMSKQSHLNISSNPVINHSVVPKKSSWKFLKGGSDGSVLMANEYFGDVKRFLYVLESVSLNFFVGNYDKRTKSVHKFPLNRPYSFPSY